MKKLFFTIIFFLGFGYVIFATLPTNVAYAAFNNQINYQGRLTTPGGIAVPNGNYNMQFNLYTVPTGGASIWTETDCYSTNNGTSCTGSGTDQRITITNGLFSVMLGSTTPFTGVNFNQTLYLGVNIGGTGSTPTYDGEMSPRKILGAVPAAMYSATSTYAGTSSVALTLNGVSNTQFFRNDQQNSTTSTSTFLSLLQTGVGKIAEFFGAASQSVLALLSNGNVGIGSSTPGAILSVQASTTNATSTLLSIASSSGASFLTVLPNGNIGIGSSTPGSLLSVVGNSFFSGNVTTTGTLAVNGATTLASSLNGLLFATNGLVGTTSTSSLGIPNYFTNSGASTSLSTGSILAAGTGTFGTINATSTTGISTFTNSAIFGAKVGIGTTTPQNSLEISGNAFFDNNISSSTTSYAVYALSTSTSYSIYANNSSNGYAVYANSSNGYAVYASGNTAIDELATTSSAVTATNGSFAAGYVSTSSSFSSISSTGNGATAFGFMTGLANSITSSGQGSFAGGVLTGTGGSIISSGLGSFAWGGNGLSATATTSTAFGTGFTDNISNSFMVGYGATPTFIVNGSNVGIGTSTPGSLLSVQGNAYFGGNITATGTLVVSGQTTLATASSTGLTVTATSTLTGLKLTNLTNTFLALDTNGNVVATTTPSGGSNYFTNSSATTSLSTGSILSALTGTFGTINATSTTGTSTFMGAVAIGTSPSSLFANTLLGGVASSSTFTQFTITNTSAASGASADFVAQNSSSTNSSYYADFGINGSQWGTVGNAEMANDAYFMSSDGNTDIEAGSSSNAFAVKIFAGGNTAANLQEVVGQASTTFFNQLNLSSSTVTNTIAGSLSVTGTTTTGNLSVGSFSGLLWGTNGVVSAISTSSLGLNYFTNSGASTTISVGSSLIAGAGYFGSITATSTTATSTFNGNITTGNGAWWPYNYLAPTFFRDDQQLSIDQSSDGLNFYQVYKDVYNGADACTVVGSCFVRDPDILFYKGLYYLTFSSISNGLNYSPISVSSDLQHWHFLAYSYTATSTHVWAPQWFVDPADGSVHILENVWNSALTSASTYETHPTNSSLTTWSAPAAITGTFTGTQMIDATIRKVGSTYYMFYSDSGSHIVYEATSTSPYSGYTMTSNSFSGVEDPNVTQVGTSTYNLYLDALGYGITYVQSSNMLTWGTSTSTVWNNSIGSGNEPGQGPTIYNMNYAYGTSTYGTITGSLGLNGPLSDTYIGSSTFSGSVISSCFTNFASGSPCITAVTPGGTGTGSIGSLQYNSSSTFAGTSNATLDAFGNAYFATSIGIGTSTPAGPLDVYYSGDQIPIMTSNTAPTGTSTCSTPYNGTVDCFMAMSGNTYNGWLTTGTSGFLEYQFPSAKVINRYSIVPWSVDNFPTRSPISWTMQGSNDGSTWTTLDTQTTFGSWSSYTPSYFSFTNTTAYLYYKLNISANGGAAYTAVQNLSLYNPVTESLTISPTTGNVGIGSSSPSSALTVIGNGFFLGNITASGTLNVLGTTTLGFASTSNITDAGFLSVIGTTTLGNVFISNVIASGTLNVTGTTSLGFASTSNITDSGYLNVSGTTTLATSLNGLLFATNGLVGTTSTSSLGIPNYFTNSSATTSLSTGSILSALTGTFGTINATSTTGTSTFAGLTTFAGNVGIGTTTPTNTLTIVSTVNGSNELIQSNANNAGLAFNNTQAGGRQFEFDSAGGSATLASTFYLNDASSSRTTFVVNSSDDVGLGGNVTSNTLAGDVLTLLHGGNVGIGSSTPGSLLSVQGNAYFGGNITATGTLVVSGQTTLATASSTGLTVTATSTLTGLKLTNLTNTFLALDTNGNVVATTTPIFSATNYFTNSGASTTLSTGSNLSAGLGYFGALISTSTLAVTGQTTLATASSTGLTVTATSTLTGLKLTNLTNTFLALDTNGNVVATTTPIFNSGWKIGNGYIANATSSDYVSIGTSSIFAKLGILGTFGSTSPIFTIASTTSAAGATSSLFTILSTGRVGIGTTSPQSTFVVSGSACIAQGTGTTTCGSTAGNIYYKAANTGNYDVAENYQTNDLSIVPGDIVAADPVTPLDIVKATASTTLLGVISTDPGLLLGGADGIASSTTARAVALSGHVPVNVDLQNGPIAIGDQIGLSSTPGVGMKANDQESVIGIALQPYSSDGEGTIEVFVNLHQYNNEASSTAATLASSTSFVQTIANAVIGTIQSVGNWVIGKLSATIIVSNDIQTQTLEAQTVTTQTAAVTNGLQMTDEATGYIYCVRIIDGDFAKVLGTCNNASSSANSTSMETSQPLTSQPPVQPVQPLPVIPPVSPTPTIPVASSSTSSMLATSSISTTSSSTVSTTTPDNSSLSVATSTPPVISVATSTISVTPTVSTDSSGANSEASTTGQ